jgi:hypothetical protein
MSYIPREATAAKVFDQPEAYATVRRERFIKSQCVPEMVGNELVSRSGMVVRDNLQLKRRLERCGT